jgi:hypothetical protein
MKRVIPYVEDTKNCLVFTLLVLDGSREASLEFDLKNAIQVHFQLEDDELACVSAPQPGGTAMRSCSTNRRGGVRGSTAPD